MTLNQLGTLTEDEMAILWYVVNNISHPGIPKIEFTLRRLTWLNHKKLIEKLYAAIPKLKPEATLTFYSLMTKLGENKDKICPTLIESLSSTEAFKNTNLDLLAACISGSVNLSGEEKSTTIQNLLTQSSQDTPQP